MKIGFLNRLIIFLATLLLLATTAVVLVITWNVFPYGDMEQYANNLYYEQINFVPATIGIFVGLVISVWLIIICFRRKKAEKPQAIQYVKIGEPGEGQIKIACSTINSMICKNISEISGVTDARAKTNVIEDKSYITVGVSISDGVVIPKVCEEIQTTTKEKIQQLTGMDIAEINILVNNKV